MKVVFRDDAFSQFKRSWPLDMVAPLDAEAGGARTTLFEHWPDLAVADLPDRVQQVALAVSPTWRDLAEALVDPNTVAAACESFLQELELLLRRRHGERRAAISLARAGLADKGVATLESLGEDWKITRERVRQLARTVAPEAKVALEWPAPLTLSIAAQYARSPRVPVTVDTFAVPATAWGRAVALALSLVSVPTRVPNDFWTETRAQAQAVEALVGALPRLVPGAASISELRNRCAAALPGLTDVLDLDVTLPFLAERLDVGKGMDGRLAFGHAAVESRVASKIVTFLKRRGAPIDPVDLARTIQRGIPPFEPFHHPLIEAAWMIDCARRSTELLAIQSDGKIGLARRLSHHRPTGTIGILQSILVDHGQPMRMLDLCDRAAAFGMSRNQVGVLIHSGRAACLFMVDRGIVGLVGRDEGAAPGDFEPAPAGAMARLHVGQEIGFGQDGSVAVNMQVRRSIREQGLAVPWPLSIVYFADTPSVHVDGQRRPVVVRTNGDLDVPDLEPGAQVQLRLTVLASSVRLDVNRDTGHQITTMSARGSGLVHPVDLPLVDGRPGWIQRVLSIASTQPRALEEMVQLMPSRMAEKRRLRALYGLVALGLVRRRGPDWVADLTRPLPLKLSAAFAAVAEDPGCYPTLPRDEQTAVVWLAWATWLVPSPGWSTVRPNDLADAGAEDDAALSPILVPTSPRETALMRIVEAAHQADDLRRHPGAEGRLDATVRIVRRYLAALGYTAYNALREATSGDGVRFITVHAATDLGPSSVWLLRPIGDGLRVTDIDLAIQLAEQKGVTTAVATDGLDLIARGASQPVELSLPSVGMLPGHFDQLILLALDPSSLKSAAEEE